METAIPMSVKCWKKLVRGCKTACIYLYLFSNFITDVTDTKALQNYMLVHVIWLLQSCWSDILDC